MERKHVGIVGAGVSGLATAKVFLSQGHTVTLFEQVGALGGVWAPSRHYPGVRLQSKRDTYSFSDFPMPDHYPEFPTGQQVYEYLAAYAQHFGVHGRIRFRTEVVGIVPRPDRKPGWRIHVRNLAEGSESSFDFDFVVVCNGIFSMPQIPEISGRAEFEAAGGIVLHSSQLRDTRPLAGRDVVVVGFGKSALDIAEAALADARSSSLVFRRSIWKVPHRIWGRIHINHFILSRFTEIWYPDLEMGGLKRFLHTWLHPLVDLFWWVSERIIGGQLGLLDPRLRPDTPLRRAAACVTLALDNLKAVREGRIGLQRGSITRFIASGLQLDDGNKLEAQAVILATGFRQECAFLGKNETARLFDADGAILLYRLLINPDIPSMGFNGYNGIGPCQLTAEVGANWLAQLVGGRLVLPNREAMLASIHAESELRTRLLSTKLRPGYYASPLILGYLDQLLRDLGLPPADRHRGLFGWLFDPIAPSDYRNLLPQPARAAASPPDAVRRASN